MKVIPLEELGRPRIDVVVNCSGVFRDLFVNQMILLDRAVKMAADQDEPLEMNFVRKHAIAQVRANLASVGFHILMQNPSIQVSSAARRVLRHTTLTDLQFGSCVHNHVTVVGTQPARCIPNVLRLNRCFYLSAAS